MSRTHDYMYRVSEALSEVMDEIGVNDRLVMKRRRVWMLMDHIRPLLRENSEFYHFGSQSEGSTTLGLKSDLDVLMCFPMTENVIQNISQWKPGVVNLMMINNEHLSPGYCYLQCFRPDLPLPVTINGIGIVGMRYYYIGVTDSEGRLILRNTNLTSIYTISKTKYYAQIEIHGPASTQPGKHGFSATDLVLSYHCESSPHQVTSWLKKQRERKWPTEDVLEECRNAGCFVVPVGSKVSYEPDLEWRISTSLQERVLMFSLNITQLRCYVLMKMILKTHINPHIEDVLTSFMCKNVLLHCIANSSQDWHTGNLLSYLHLCLFMLKECVEQRNCPHFMIPENNLLAKCMTDEQRGNLLNTINNLMKNDEQFLYDIQIDDLGRRLKMKLNMVSYYPNILSATYISQHVSFPLVFQIAMTTSAFLNMVLYAIQDFSLEMALLYLVITTTKLIGDKRKGGSNQNTASKLLITLLRSSLGSVIASTNIASHTAISDQAFTYLEEGKESDALSGRLKLVSVLYCTGDLERAESELRIIATQYNISELHTVCEIRIKDTNPTSEFMKACDDYNEEAIKYVSFCTRFIQCEINCVPHELRYEILKSFIKEDRQMRLIVDSMWMDLIVVDSIPYFYFLQYKTYRHLQRRTEQLQALSNLAQSIYLGDNLGHVETAFNLLGQCYEQENRQTEAFLCYISSLKHRGRNNAASFLVCIQLFKLWKQDNTQ